MKKILTPLLLLVLLSSLLPTPLAQKAAKRKKEVTFPAAVTSEPITDLSNIGEAKWARKIQATGAQTTQGPITLPQASAGGTLVETPQGADKASPAISQEAGIMSSVVASGTAETQTGSSRKLETRGPIYDEVPPLSPEQLDRMDDEMKKINPSFIPPIGEVRKVIEKPLDPPTDANRPTAELMRADTLKQRLKAPRNAATTPQAANDLVYGAVRDVPTTAAAQRSTINEPSLGNMGDTVFFTGNWYAARSGDAGRTFTYVNPSNTFPSINGGFCCDQLADYAPNQDMMLWALQYNSDGNSGTLRLARALGSTQVMNNQWSYLDYDPQSDFGFPAGNWMDYPNMVVASNYLYLASNVFDNNDRFSGSVVWRVSLAELASASTVNHTYYKSLDSSPRLAQGAKDTMYWATHRNTSQLRIFRWADGVSQPTWSDVNINSYTFLARDGVATSPDGTNWAARADSRITGAWVAKGIIGFMWSAKQDAQHPYPYTIVARFNESTRALVSQNDVWSTQSAWLYPTASVNASGNLGGMIMFGGGGLYPGTNIWISDDVQSGFNPLALYGATESNRGPTRNAWGDYHTVHPHKDSPNTWVGATYYIQNGGDGANIVPRYLWFGRERDFGCSLSISPTSQSFNSAGGSGSVGITASTASCNWSAVSNASWINITSSVSGTGNGSVTFSVAANSTTSQRTGTLTVAGRTFTVTQAASSCTFGLSPTSASVGAAGGSSTVGVTTSSTGCAWSAASNASWLTITSGANGTGNGSVSYTAAANTSTSSRTGTLTIAGITFTVTQAAGGGGGGCSTSPISFGATVSGSLQSTDCVFSDGSYYDIYTFSGTAGQSVIVNMSSNTFDTYLFLLSPSGSVLASDDDGGGGTNSRIPTGTGGFTLPTSGTYRIYANSFAGGVTGSYTLRVEASAACSQTPISVGQTRSGTLSTTDCRLSDGSYFDSYSFNGTNGQQIAISMSSSFDTYLFLFSPNGQVLSFDDDGGDGVNSRIPADSGFITLPSSGVYTIGATSYYPDTTGSYTVTLTGGGSAHHQKTAGVFRPSNGIVYLKNQNTGGFADISLIYGNAGDMPIAGDWNGDGTDSMGIYRNGVFYLRNSNTTGPADVVFPFGAPGDQPVAGDWDGDGIVTIGVYRSNQGVFFLRNSNTAGPADMSFVLGNPGDMGIAGDWDGDGITSTGVFRPSNGIVYLKNQNTGGFADIFLVYGNAGDWPLAGDWNADGIDSVGIYRNGVFYLRNSNTQGVADIVFALGNPGDVPVAGDWDGLP